MPDIFVKDIDYSLLPEHMIAGTKRYIEDGVPGGHFLTAILENDFMNTVCNADGVNIKHLKEWAIFLYNKAPASCWGNRKKVREWTEHGGLKGFIRA